LAALLVPLSRWTGAVASQSGVKEMRKEGKKEGQDRKRGEGGEGGDQGRVEEKGRRGREERKIGKERVEVI
jgi:hypothetical protein